MTNARDMVHSSGNATFATVYSEQVIPFLIDASWLLVLPLIMVSVDCWFGISESRQRKEVVRFSGAGWKTLRKLLDYYTLLTLGFVVGHILPGYINTTVSEACFYSVLIPSFFDLCSIIGHILILKGIKISPRRFLVNLFVGFVKTKNNDIGTALEEGINKELDNNTNNTKQ